jgi:serine phosphatase RsbU (regulator of sigma subunit)
LLLRGVDAGLITIVVLVVLDGIIGERSLPLTSVVIAPLVTSTLSGPLGTAVVALLATASAVVLGVDDGIFGTLDHGLRIAVVVGGGLLAVLLSANRMRRERRLSQAERVAALSQALQTGLLPNPVVGDAALRVTTRYRPGERLLLLGGDFYDVVARGDGSLAFLIGDVAGHGPVAASVSASLRAGWRTLVFTGDDPARWLDVMNRALPVDASNPELFVTACTGLIDADRSVATLVAAGHPPPIRLTDVAEIVEVKPGPPLGIATGAEDWTPADVVLGQEWGLLLYTDGLIEGRRAPGSAERYGMESLAGWLSALPVPRRIAADDLDRLLDDIEAANGRPFADDVAVILLRASPTP